MLIKYKPKFKQTKLCSLPLSGYGFNFIGLNTLFDKEIEKEKGDVKKVDVLQNILKIEIIEARVLDNEYFLELFKKNTNLIKRKTLRDFLEKKDYEYREIEKPIRAKDVLIIHKNDKLELEKEIKTPSKSTKEFMKQVKKYLVERHNGIKLSLKPIKVDKYTKVI